MNRLILAGVTLVTLVTAGVAGPAAPPMADKASPPLVYKAAPSPDFVGNAKPKTLPASATKNDVMFREFLEWLKKQKP